MNKFKTKNKNYSERKGSYDLGNEGIKPMVNKEIKNMEQEIDLRKCKEGDY